MPGRILLTKIETISSSGIFFLPQQISDKGEEFSVVFFRIVHNLAQIFDPCVRCPSMFNFDFNVASPVLFAPDI